MPPSVLEAYPLHVARQLTGEWFVLQHWTPNERGHLILARSERAVQIALARVFTTRWCRMGTGGMELRDYLRIEMVAPPMAARERFAESEHRSQVDWFWGVLSHKARCAVDAGLSIPGAPLTACSEAAEAPDHRGCAAECEWGFTRALSGAAAETYFWEHIDTVNLGVGMDPREEPEPAVYRARSPVEGEALGCAFSDPGHHSAGSYLSTWDPDCGGFRGLLFFYRTLARLDRSALDRMLVEEQARRDEVERREKEERAASDAARGVPSPSQRDIARAEALRSFCAEMGWL